MLTEEGFIEFITYRLGERIGLITKPKPVDKSDLLPMLDGRDPYAEWWLRELGWWTW